MSTLPVIIYVSGAPGTGKTTLAQKISDELYIPHVSSDLVHGGVSYTLGGKNDRLITLHETFVPLLIDLSKKSISFVVDHVLQKNLSETDILDKITPFAQVIYVHLYTENPIERHLQRELKRSDMGVQLNDNELHTRAKYHQDNLVNTKEPLAVTLPTIVVDTTDGYNPAFEKIIQFIKESR